MDCWISEGDQRWGLNDEASKRESGFSGKITAVTWLRGDFENLLKKCDTCRCMTRGKKKLPISCDFELLKPGCQKNTICLLTVGCGAIRSDGGGWCAIWKDAHSVMMGNGPGWFKCRPSDLGMDDGDLKGENGGKGEK